MDYEAEKFVIENGSVALMINPLAAVDHFEVLPGLRLTKTPGHSAGHQSVLVNTREGMLCIAGDALNLVENLTSGTPPGILFSTEEALRSGSREVRDRQVSQTQIKEE